MCNCINELQDKFAKNLAEKGFVLDENPKIEAVFTLSGGEFSDKSTFSNLSFSIKKTYKNGNTKSVKQKQKLLHSFCPFCGEKKGGDE
ncbi:hypothetical protein PL75_03440 [Neisseria arctica]|uniref:Uncharacterized protein n=1 Tax=Neisseria arctica TaxID=1470200 RepID=A0A0J0YT58_9NEIS|nr:hypothetical protein [Neisseria arctica]KLT73287.1 hypothetical protein PL75_03440 [Neisseria arctica]UOO87451.1 hypothetical protein LVJ86_04200 [Neisseria arctica]